MKNSFDYEAFVAILFLLLGYALVFFPFFILDGLCIGHFQIKIGNYHELGAFITGVTAPFLSGAAFILLYKTYSSQKSELKKQREYIDRQEFESIFFKMINLHHQSGEDTSMEYQGSILKGKFCFVHFNTVEKQKGYNIFKVNFSDPFCSYISLFFHILRFIDKTVLIPKESCSFYIEMFLASLTKDEKILLLEYYKNQEVNQDDSQILTKLNIKELLENP